MAKFCTKCGRPLIKGQICVCQRGKETESGPARQEAGFAAESQDFTWETPGHGAEARGYGDGASFAGAEPEFDAGQPGFVGTEPEFGSDQASFAGNGPGFAEGGQEFDFRQEQAYQQEQVYQQEQQTYQQEQAYQQEQVYQQEQQTYRQERTAGQGAGQGYQQQAQQPGGGYQDPAYERNYRQTSEGMFSSLNGISAKLGGFLDLIYNFITPTDRPGRVNNMVPGRKLLGLSKEDRIAQVGDCYERGGQIVPDMIQPCGQEIPIRQYDLCTTRSLLKGTWQEGKLQITNKRVLFRLSGRNWIGRTQKSIEYALDDVVGIEMKNGNRLSFVALLLNSVIISIFTALGMTLSETAPILGVILGLIAVVGISLLLKKHYYAKAVVFGFALPCILYLQEDGSKASLCVIAIVSLGFLIYYLLASVRPNFSFKVLTKSGSSSPIEEKRVDTVLAMLFDYFIARGMDVLPGRDADRAMDEVGAMIIDIQKFGDFGIQKWKQ